MASPELGTLEEMHLRHVWDHEALSFTPWLFEHLDRLAEVIGIPLEPKGKEVAVDEYSADILARNSLDDSLVLIENQIEVADHRHLGQILTYASGLDASTVVWIASRFRDAHLSAVQWLNDHTDDRLAFFAVRIKIVRIGDSLPAPVFEVLARPNDWDRQLHEVAKQGREISELGAFRRSFWEHLTELYSESSGITAPTAASGIAKEYPDQGLAIVRYVGKREVGIFVRALRGSNSENLIERLAPVAETLSDQLGAQFNKPGSKYLFVKSLKIDMSDRTNWDRAAEWLVATARTYEEVLRGACAGPVDGEATG